MVPAELLGMFGQKVILSKLDWKYIYNTATLHLNCKLQEILFIWPLSFRITPATGAPLRHKLVPGDFPRAAS